VRRRQDEAVDVRVGGVNAEAVGAERQKCRGGGGRGVGGEGVVRGVEGVGPLDEHLFEIVEDAASFSHAGGLFDELAVGAQLAEGDCEMMIVLGGIVVGFGLCGGILF